jgi:hypothetical protein
MTKPAVSGAVATIEVISGGPACWLEGGDVRRILRRRRQAAAREKVKD